MANIDIPCIADALGHSIIYEEYKGNYAKARKAAEKCLNEAYQNGNIIQQADAQFSCGLVSLLQGEPPLALRYFNEVHRLVPEDVARRYRAVVYANLATYRQFNAFPNESGAGAIEISARWDGPTVVGHLDKQLLEFQANISDQVLLLERKLVVDVLSTGLSSRSILEGLENQTPENAQQITAAAFQPLIQFQDILQAVGNPPELQAYVTWLLADLCRRSRQYEEGQQLLNQAIQIYTQAGDQIGIALCQMSWGDWLSAPYSSPMVWNFAIQSSSTEGSRLSWVVEFKEFSQAGLDTTNALAAYDQAEQRFQDANAPRGLAAIALRRAYLAMLRGDYRSAIELTERAQNGFETCGDLQGFRCAQVHRILSRVGAGEFPEERDTAGEIGSWGAGQGSFSYTLGLGLMLGRAGRHWLIRQGDYEHSLACYRLAEALFAELGAVVNQAQSLVDQGDVYQAIGDRITALTLYERALDAYVADIAARPFIAQEVSEQTLSLSVTVFNLYLQYMQADGMERSAKRMQYLLDQFTDGKEDVTGIADLIGGGLKQLFSTGLDQTNIIDKGKTTVNTWALTNLVRTTLEQARVLIPTYRAIQVRDQGNLEAANKGFAQARDAALKASSEIRYLMDSIVLAHQKEYSAAAAVFKRHMAEKAKGSGFTDSLVQFMSSMAAERGQEETRRQAENDLEEAFTFLTRCKAYKEAYKYLEALIQSAGSDWWQRDPRPWLILSDCGELYEGLEQLEKALVYYDQAISELEKRRNQLSRDELKTALAADKGTQFLYFQAARTAHKITLQAEQEGNSDLQMKFTARMFEYAERNKARALLDLMATSAASISVTQLERGVMNNGMHTWRQINAQLTLRRGLLAQERNRPGDAQDSNRINQLQQQIEADEKALHRVESVLAESNPGFYRVINPQTPVMNLDQVKKAFPPNTALLQYYFLGEEILSWAITTEGMVEVHRAPLDVKAFERQVNAFHRACQEQRSVTKIGKEMADTLLAPFANTINACQHLLIVPYGETHALPFHVLPWNDQPLSVSHSVRYLPSTSTLQFLKNRLTTDLDSILAFGNPANMRFQAIEGIKEQAPTLPWAATEASYVASLFQEGKALIGEKATEESFRQRLKERKILHLATHGFLSVDSPLASSILFAEGQELTVYELMGLQLEGQLVVLSACQTAQGEITGGDDVLGFTRGLLGAGAGAAIVSLWPVNDLSTSLFMGEFYRQLLADEAPAVALQAAQNYLRGLDNASIQSEIDKLYATLQAAHVNSDIVNNKVENKSVQRNLRTADSNQIAENYSHPYYWAPFILVG